MKAATFFLAIVFLCFKSWALREVEFEWNEVPGARSYQVEIKNNSNLVMEEKSKTNTFKIKISPGKYQIRGKALGFNGVHKDSEWSFWKSFDVPPASPIPLGFKKFDFSVEPKTYLSNISVGWDPVAGAAEYQVIIGDINGKTKKVHTIKNSNIHLRLRPGYYSFMMKSITADGLESEPFVLPQQILVQNLNIPEPQKLLLEVEKSLLTFEPAPGTSVVVLMERQAFLGRMWGKIDQKMTTKNSYQWATPLKPGKYRLTLLSQNSFKELSKPVFKEFVIKPKEQDLPL